MKIVECVPNFSEGRNKETVEKISRAVGSVPGAELLDVDSGYDTNRTVYTFAGNPESVLTAAFEAIKTGADIIDMSKHIGSHPRLGACDVCPIVPVSGVSMEECADLARELGRKVAEELDIPVYLYENAALSEGRKNLADIRSGEYEGIEEKLKNPEWKPDFGPAVYNKRIKKTGATVIGAREFLIAYNINIQSEDKNLASKIAGRIREKGTTVKDKDGKAIKVPGRLKNCKAIGWYAGEYKRAQVSVNLTDWHVTNMHHAYEAVKEEGNAIGVGVTGSEIVGLVPAKALLDSGLFYLKKRGKVESGRADLGKADQGKEGQDGEKEIIEAAVVFLGLNDVAPFEPAEKIIEYRLGDRMR
jgi:glutamate formiminotransferase/formiminotetrahydrofolate cyclodeaminase